MKKIFILLLSLFVISLAVVSPSLSFASNATSQSDVCQGVGIIHGSDGGCNQSSGTTIDGILSLVLNLFSAIAGITAVIMLIIAGSKYVTSSGNPERTNQAKDTILYAVIGLVLVALAQIIIKLVLHKAYLL